MESHKYSNMKYQMLRGVYEEVTGAIASYLYEENIIFMVKIEGKSEYFCIGLIMLE